MGILQLNLGEEGTEASFTTTESHTYIHTYIYIYKQTYIHTHIHKEGRNTGKERFNKRKLLDMKINFKTLDRKTFCLEVTENDSVADLKTRLEDDFGKQNMFRLLYSGDTKG